MQSQNDVYPQMGIKHRETDHSPMDLELRYAAIFRQPISLRWFMMLIHILLYIYIYPLNTPIIYPIMIILLLVYIPFILR